MYLTENKLKNFLNIKFKNEFIYNKSVPNSLNKKFKPDFRSELNKLIIEFDGYRHYSVSKQIKNDLIKDAEYINLGYKIFRIPYFIQLSSDILFLIFNKNIKIYQIYPHGFIDSAALLPADFCELGIEKFKKDLNKFKICEDKIILSLKNKILEKNDIDLVLPKSLQYLIK